MDKKNIKIAVSVVTFSKNNSLVTQLGGYFPNYILNNVGRRYTEQELINSLKDADGAIIGLDKIDENILKHCPKLKVIAKYGIGLDKIDFDACKKYGVEVFPQEGTNKRSVSELTLGFMLDLMRGGYNSSVELKKGNWNKYENNARELTGKIIGIIGVGNIGKDLVSLLNPFNCKILANDIREDKAQLEFYKENNIDKSSKETIYSQSDILTLHVPLTSLTKEIINFKSLSTMKPTSFLINTCRGEVVNEIDLFYSLKNKEIAGVALDVYQNEEKPDFYKTTFHEELFSLPNVIPTPHIGGTSKESSFALGMTAIQNLKNYFVK